MSLPYDMLPSNSPEIEPRDVDTVVILDMDRTLLDTDEVTQALCDMLVLHGVTEKEINHQKDHILANNGKSFNMTDYLVAQHGPDIIELIKQDLLNLAESPEIRQRLLFPGVTTLLDALTESNIPHAILTHGDQQYQEFKLELLRKLLDRTAEQLPGQVTLEKYKSEWIHKNWYIDGQIIVPREFCEPQPLRASQVIVLDDKVNNLVSPDIGLKGVLIDNTSQSAHGTYHIRSVAELVHQGGRLDAFAAWYKRNAA